MASRQGGRSVSINNLSTVIAAMNEIEKELQPEANTKLRRYTKQLASATVIPALKRGAEASGVPIAPKMADTARVKSDRMVTVRIGAVNPKLSGFKSGIGAAAAGRMATRKGGNSKSSQSYRTTLAWGSDKGPHPASDVNHYGVGRSGSHWVLPTLAGPLFDEVRDKYNAFLSALLVKYGGFR